MTRAIKPWYEQNHDVVCDPMSSGARRRDMVCYATLPSQVLSISYFILVVLVLGAVIRCARTFAHL